MKGGDSIWMRYPVRTLKFSNFLWNCKTVVCFPCWVCDKRHKLTPRRKGKVLAPKQIIIEIKVKPKGK